MLALADRFGQLPSTIMDLPAAEVAEMIAYLRIANEERG